MKNRGKSINKWNAKRCSKCNRIIRDFNKSGLCSICHQKLYSKKQIDERRLKKNEK